VERTPLKTGGAPQRKVGKTAKPVLGIEGKRGYASDVTPRIFWLPDLGSNQGPTD